MPKLCNNSPPPSSNSGNLNNVDSQQPSSSLTATTQRPRRTLAKRSCFNCREKKTRCELPDLFVPSSKEPVIESKRCHRCKVLGIDCVVWDGDRKRKLNLPAQKEESCQDLSTYKRTRSSWGPTSHLADAAEVLSAATESYGSAPASPSSASAHFKSGSRSNTPFSSLQDQTPHRTSNRESHSSVVSTTISSKDDRGDAHGHSAEAMQKDQFHIGPQPHEVSTMQPADCLHMGDGKETGFFQRAQHQTHRSVWRTLSIIVDYAAQRSQFTSYLLYRIATPQRSIRAIDILDTIDRKECYELDNCMMPYLAWHPHLPSLKLLYDIYTHQPTMSTAFLLASMYLVTSRHRHSLSSTLMRGLSAAVDRLGTQMILSSIRDIRVVQAFELLIAHEPSLIGTGVCGDEKEQAYRAGGLAGESLLTNAISISKELGLDKSIYRLHKLITQPQEKSQGEISELLIASSLWVNLRVWDGHYVFFKPVNRVLRDLGDLAQMSACMIAIDEFGNRIKENPASTYGITATRDSDHRNETEESLRSAGRTVLAYRIQAMASSQGALSRIIDILKSAKDKSYLEQSHGYSYRTQPNSISPQVRDKIVQEVFDALEERSRIEEDLQMDMMPFTNSNFAHLAEEWTQLELKSLLSMLCAISVCSLYIGEIDTGFPTKPFIEALQQDEQLRNCVGKIGGNRLDLAEKLVSSFVFFNRRSTISTTTTSAHKKPDGVVELTGAPYFLTCAFVVDACRQFLEGTAFVLVTYHSIQQNYDARLLSMIQAAQRLEEFDRNRYDQVDDNALKDGSTKSPLSICQLSAKFIRDMIEIMQKWRLNSSKYRKPEIIVGPWGPSRASPSARMRDSVSRDTPDSMTDDGRTVEDTPQISSSGSEFGSNMSPLQSKLNSQSTPMLPAGHPIATVPIEAYYTNTASTGFMNTLPTNSVYTVQSQAGLAYSTQLWQPEAGNIRAYGSMDNLLAGAFPDANATSGGTGGAFDISMLDTYLDSLFQQ